jgi:hypothetical protein
MLKLFTKNLKNISKLTYKSNYTFITKKYFFINYTKQNIFNFYSIPTRNYTTKNKDPNLFDLEAEFENALSQQEENQEKRVKLLSIKLLQLTKPEDIIRLFENKFQSYIGTIYGEELTLLIYFYTSLLDNDPGRNTSSKYLIKYNIKI